MQKEVHMPEYNFEREVLDRLKTIEVKLDSYEKIKEQVYENQRINLIINDRTNQQQKEIDEIRERSKYYTRTAVAALIAGGIAIVFLFIKMGMGVA